jgi:hypothetical protein
MLVKQSIENLAIWPAFSADDYSADGGLGFAAQLIILIKPCLYRRADFTLSAPLTPPLLSTVRIFVQPLQGFSLKPITKEFIT